MTKSTALPYDEFHPLRRIEGESEEANNALRDYVDLGPKRSISKLFEHYALEAEYDQFIVQRSYNTLTGWGRHFHWRERAKAWLSLERMRFLERHDERRTEIMSRGYKISGVLFDILDEIIEDMVETGGQVSPAKLRHIVTTRIEIEKLARLSAGMPMQYREQDEADDTTAQHIMITIDK